jgi:hypothetical protein
VSEQPSGAITNADLYRKIEDLRVSVTINLERIMMFDRLVSDHEGRLRVLERFRFTLLGAASMIGAVSGVTAAIITHLLVNHGHL